jgi:hypothetical protein
LTEHIVAQDGLWNSNLLDCRAMTMSE